MGFLSFENVTKRFPGVLALDRVSFNVQRGSCHALIGENGAGKSTLGKILAGVLQTDQGQVRMDGRLARPADPWEARQLGIAMVHQELAFCPNLSVAENLCLGNLPRRFGWVDRGRMRDQAKAMLRAIESDLDVDQPMSRLSTGQEQMVQIAAAVGTGAQVLVMDEPTSSLSAHETEHLFHLMDQLRSRTITVLYVSHRMDEIFRRCDAITVLRDGRHVATGPAAATSPNQVIHQMIGREVTAHRVAHRDRPLGEVLLRVEDLASPGKFSGVTFELREGEVLGFAGLVGAGRSELAQAIFGLDPAVTGRCWMRGEPMPMRGAGPLLARGLGLVPEDRKRQGLVLSMNCRENTTLAHLPALTRLGWVRRQAEEALARRYTDRLRIRTPSLEAPVAGLSGGNQQKIALAKWLACQSHVLMVDEPTRGIDVGAKAEIHRILDELACQGMAILLISSELPEVMSLSRRMAVMRQGQIAGWVDHRDFSEPGLMRMMAGYGEE